MEELKIAYTLPAKVKIMALLAGGFLFALATGVGITEALHNRFGFLFYVGVAGVAVAVLQVSTVTIWQADFHVVINQDEMRIRLPKQHIDGSVLWETVTELGIGLSYLTLTTTGTNYKIDLGNLKYNDLKRIKSKLIEVCEAKSIPFGNI